MKIIYMLSGPPGSGKSYWAKKDTKDKIGTCIVSRDDIRFSFLNNSDNYFAREDDLANPIPSIRTLGTGIYIKYLLSIVLVFNIILFFIQSFTLSNIVLTLLRIVASTILSTLLIFGIDSLDNTKREKRL